MRGQTKKSIMYIVMAMMLTTTIFFQQPLQASAFSVNAEAAILVDANSGRILYQDNIDANLYIASMTKMMSEYLILEAIDEGRLEWDQTVPISSFVRQLSLYTDLSNVPLRQDETYTVKELYESIAIYSANASTIAIAELLYGSETGFVKAMNDKAEELGLTDYFFVNSTGLNNSNLLGQHPDGTAEDEENRMSARATAKLAYHLINDYPEVLDTASIPDMIFKEGTEDQIEMKNWNWMLVGSIEPQFDYSGIDGLKTGYTSKAGNNFTATAVRNGTRLISVVMNTGTRADRFNETEKLLDYGFNNFETIELLPSGYQVENGEMLPVSSGKEAEVSISTEEPLSLVIRRGEEELYTPVLTVDGGKLNDDGALSAPIEAGEVVGTVHLSYSGTDENEYLVENAEQTVNAITDHAVERAGWFSRTMSSIGGFFSGIWTAVSDTIKGLF
ncbi:D-alanyl-D-alanine carboxypeptidase family protein [Bacillus alkalicellulosilyticus]|uniref:D-alanyl-D-alanine carboxypeptidase family protein n=1 Tax=Alkalihalobacterium alkalicellulosilyticum TaxID=1912214 RepID=UPI001FEA9747|nr:D-alanyl-D-alanine carboxypeptidase family protein [Bacillus alkalicellulosilyticus]